METASHASDLATLESAQRLLDEVAQKYGHVDFVLNTAGRLLRPLASQEQGSRYDRMFAYSIYVDEQQRRASERYQQELRSRPAAQQR
jgi:NAD(P)-dependent dehydrogenase (short-subunit alcohol dehydrogenase family)